jgi:phage shock protein C
MTKLYRSNRDKKLFGLCGGLAELFNIDATILRLIVAIGVVFSGGTVLLLYIVACLVIPKEPEPFNAGPQQGFSGGFYHHAPPVPPRQAQGSTGHQQAAPAARPDSGIDDMMKDIEKKAMQKEIEELKAKLAQLEKGE